MLEPKYRKSQTALANTANISMSNLTLASLFIDQVLKTFLLKRSGKRALQSSINKTVSLNFIFFSWLSVKKPNCNTKIWNFPYFYTALSSYEWPVTLLNPVFHGFSFSIKFIIILLGVWAVPPWNNIISNPVQDEIILVARKIWNFLIY